MERYGSKREKKYWETSGISALLHHVRAFIYLLQYMFINVWGLCVPKCIHMLRKESWV